MSLTPPMPSALPGPAGVARYKALAFFAALAAITYLDRICMAQAADPISRALGLDKRQMGWVFSAFTLAYTLFEVPTGWLGDRIGPRKVLVRVVLWWSVFTALTGWAGSLAALLLIRFAFGMGEAGAFPNIARGLTRWFPHEQRGRAQGVIWTTARLGGAVAPPLTAIVMAFIGWRATFVVYAAIRRGLGLVVLALVPRRARRAPGRLRRGAPLDGVVAGEGRRGRRQGRGLLAERPDQPIDLGAGGGDLLRLVRLVLQRDLAADVPERGAARSTWARPRGTPRCRSSSGSRAAPSAAGSATPWSRRWGACAGPGARWASRGRRWPASSSCSACA